ncbi:MCE family protein [Nocardioides caeni]|uniref:MCE family protein n=1 Tax=Nocardioides caeni TaxID=574700 RepID=A0A4S8N181_9ACTN|nr:MlaD family protein [Nocardioides caeni]THV08839.1 MCE family protein [Nocardioides caeni]
MNLVHRIRIGVFAVVAVASIIFAGVQYIGVPERYLGQSYEIAVNLPESGGIFPNAEVTLRGVPIGRVTSLELTPDGVRAYLRLEKDIRIPEDTLVKVAHLSAVGEQYVDLIPPSDEGPYLADGDALPVSAATTPLKVTSLLVHLDQLATSIGKPALRRVVRELGDAFDRSGQDLATVLVRARELSATFAEVQPTTDRLLEDGRTVLATQRDLDPELQQLTRGLDDLTETIADMDPQIASILSEAPATLTEVSSLLSDNQANVSVLLGNLLSVTEILAEPIRLRGLNTQLVLLPRIIQGTFNIQPGDGYARLGAVIDTTQAVCTRGYESSGTPPTQGTKLSEVAGNPSYRANLNAFCAEPVSSGIGVRGAAHVPRPAGDDTARVIARPNPRGFGPGSSFTNEAGEDEVSPAAGQPVSPSSTRMLPPSDLAGLLIKEDLR